MVDLSDIQNTKFSFEQEMKDEVILKFSNKQGGDYNVFAFHWQCFAWAAIVGFLKVLRLPLETKLTNKIFSLNTINNNNNKKVAHAILDGECEKGILICGTGIGISITANKIPGIRAAVCTDCFTAQATREHNDSNILALGGRVVGPGLAIKIVETFLETPFSNDERHIRRIKLIEEE